MKPEKLIMSEITNPIALPDAIYEDSRGKIISLAELDYKSALIIESKAGTTRANHYHLEDWHYCYLISGKFKYHWRQNGDKGIPAQKTIQAGEIVITPSKVEHAFHFLEDSIFVVLSGRARDQKNYEADLIRVELI
jgi:quercetin dioxygenase-like cupin family protein